MFILCEIGLDRYSNPLGREPMTAGMVEPRRR